MQSLGERASIWHPRFFVRLAVSFLPAAGLVFAVFLILGRNSLSSMQASADSSGWYSISLAQSLVAQQMNSARADTLVLASAPAMTHWADDSSRTEDVIAVLSALCLRKPHYAQVRLLDLDGREVARVNEHAGDNQIVPPEDLQDKSHRYYFIEARKLKPGQIYLSDLDLNIEHGVIVQPLEPTVRLVTPVSDSRGVVKGFVALNYNAGGLFLQIDRVATTQFGDLHVLNNDGYWLTSPNVDDEWGFMFHNRTDRRLAIRYPPIWEAMKTGRTGSETLDLGQFRWLRIPLLDAGDAKHTSGEAPIELILLSFTDAEQVSRMTHEAYRPYTRVMVLALLVLFAGSFGMTHYWNRVELADAQKRILVAALQNSPCGVLVTYRDGEIFWVNDPFCAMLGYQREELIGKKPEYLLAAASQENFHQRDITSEVDRDGHWQGEVELQARGGETSIYSIVVSPASWTLDQSTQLYLMVALDISKQKATEQAYDLARQRADGANRAKSIFLSNMSHEIRTPMNAVLGFAQLLQLDPALTARQHEQIELINSSGKHLLALINDVLEMARIESGQIILNETDIDPRGLMQNLADMFTHRAKSLGLEFQIQVEHSVPPSIVLDERKFRQIMINLISNALKFTRRGSVRVIMRLVNMDSDGQNCLCASVEDTGVGIEEADIDRIFKPFEQVNCEQGTTNEGTGLGLAICRRYAAVMDGELKVDSIRSQGSRFSLILPLVVGGEPECDPFGVHRHILYRLPDDHPPLRILTVDDKESNRKLVTAVLEATGIEVRSAENGAVGVEMAIAWKPDLIFLDLVMPVMDGFEAIRRIRSHPTTSAIPIVALTASVFGLEVSNHLEIGVERIIRKPFLMSELRVAIEDLLAIKMVPIELPNEMMTKTARDDVAATTTETPLGDDNLENRARCGDLSHDLRDAIVLAALALDSDAMEGLIVAVHETDPKLAGHLTEWVERFDFNTILTCFEPGEVVDE